LLSLSEGSERERERERERESGFKSLTLNSAVMKAAEIHMVGTGCCVIRGGVESVVVIEGFIEGIISHYHSFSVTLSSTILDPN
jgi:hypothetical protein